MNENKFREYLKAEENVAHIHGWDFSHIHGRYTEETDLPWDYEQVIRRYLRPEHRLLDLDTGGGEFLLSLGHPYENTSATEAYPPNAELCRQVLLPKGIDFHEAAANEMLPFADGVFDVIINRHGEFQAEELYRILKPGGLFITQQVGENNDRELVKMLLPEEKKPFHDLNLTAQKEYFEQVGFTMLEGQEAYRPIRFYDSGALVWFARIIEWEFPGFSVDRCFDRLCEVQKEIEKNGEVSGLIHRYLMVMKKSI